MKEFKKIISILFISTVFLIASAIFAIYKQSMDIKNLSILIGFGMIFEGFCYLLTRKYNAKKFKIFNYFIHYGLASILIGILVILNIGIIKIPLNFIVGVYFIFSALIKFSLILLSKKISNQLKIITIISSILSLSFAILMLVNPFENTIYVSKMVGIYILINCILFIMHYNSLRKNNKKFTTAKGK